MYTEALRYITRAHIMWQEQIMISIIYTAGLGTGDFLYKSP